MEELLIPAEIVEQGLDDIEERSADAQDQIVRTASEAIADQALPMVQAGNIDAISDLSWNLRTTLQAPIYQAWAEGFDLGGAHMQLAVRAAVPAADRQLFSGVPERRKVRRYQLTPDVVDLLDEFFLLSPGQLVASAANAAILRRMIQLAGSFSQSQMLRLKQDLIAAITPQAATGDPINRAQLLGRIQAGLNVGRVRADNIARTELTTAYNTGRRAMGSRSELVEAFQLVPILDTRTTEICRSRAGMVIPVTDQVLLDANTPSLHFRCRTILSPVLPRVNDTHREWFEDSDRRAQNRVLEPFLPGWR